MHRRGFLSLLGAVAATAAIDPERLLWRPGAKLISIPALRPHREFVREFIPGQWKMGDTLFVRKPARFIARWAPPISPAR